MTDYLILLTAYGHKTPRKIFAIRVLKQSESLPELPIDALIDKIKKINK